MQILIYFENQFKILTGLSNKIKFFYWKLILISTIIIFATNHFNIPFTDSSDFSSALKRLKMFSPIQALLLFSGVQSLASD